MQLNYFEGQWHFTRNIDNGARAQGIVICSKTHASQLLYKEVGELTLPNNSVLTAKNQYIIDVQLDAISFYFLDGSIFQEFNISTNTLNKAATSTHLCGEDTYISALTLHDKNTFTLTHNVTGPRKRYTMETVYTRQKKQRI